MIKQLLVSTLAIAASMTISATTIKVWEGNTQLKGWSDNVSVPASEFTAASEGSKLVVNITVDMTLDPTINYTNLGVKTNTNGWPELDGTGFQNPTGTDASWDLNATAASQLKNTGLIIQGQNIVVTSVDLITAEDIDPNILFEGELVISGWNSGATINPSKLNAGDAIKYTFSAPGSTDGQVLVKNSSWANLLGTAKIGYSDMATGSVVVGVTEEMLQNANGSIFVQGDGGCTITKVERIPDAFNPTNVICYGERACGANVFTVIPEGTSKLSVVFAKMPGWAQICDNSWTALHSNDEATTVENSDGSVTMTFPITAEDIAKINNAKELVVNSDQKLISLNYPGAESAIESIEANDTNAPVEYFNLQGIRVANPENGIFIRRQGNQVSKVRM